MSSLKTIYCFWVCIFLFYACTSDSSSKTSSSFSPEQVSRKWQAHIDNNEFEEALLLSTTNTKKWINEIKTMVVEDEYEEEVLPSSFIVMTCVEKEKTACCKYVSQEEEEKVVDSILLVRQNGQWLVDLPKDLF